MLRKWLRNWWDILTKTDGANAIGFGAMSLWAAWDHAPFWAAFLGFMSGRAFSEWDRMRRLKKRIRSVTAK